MIPHTNWSKRGNSQFSISFGFSSERFERVDENEKRILHFAFAPKRNRNNKIRTRKLKSICSFSRLKPQAKGKLVLLFILSMIRVWEQYFVCVCVCAYLLLLLVWASKRTKVISFACFRLPILTTHFDQTNAVNVESWNDWAVQWYSFGRSFSGLKSLDRIRLIYCHKH